LHFKRRNDEATTEAEAKSEIFLMIIGRTNIPSGYNQVLNNVTPPGDHILNAQPDYFNSAKRNRHGSESENPESEKRSTKASDDGTISLSETATATEDINAKATPNVLCAVCKATIVESHLLNNRIQEIEITLNSWGCTERWKQFAHHSSLEALKASARAECHLCTLLCEIVNDESIDQVIEVEQKRRKTMFPILWKATVLLSYPPST
jgi:hypothetical protein